MSKVFVDVEESDSLKIAVVWTRNPDFALRRILLAGSDSEMDALFAKNGYPEFRNAAESEKALQIIISMLAGSDGAELEPMLSMQDVKGFTLKALQILRQNVPRGRVISYGQLAALCGSPDGARAAGMAMAANPFPLFHPCHRVVGADGSLGGFGFGADLKRRLLQMEGVRVDNGEINLKEFGIIL